MRRFAADLLLKDDSELINLKNEELNMRNGMNFKVMGERGVKHKMELLSELMLLCL